MRHDSSDRWATAFEAMRHAQLDQADRDRAILSTRNPAIEGVNVSECKRGSTIACSACDLSTNMVATRAVNQDEIVEARVVLNPNEDRTALPMHGVVGRVSVAGDLTRGSRADEIVVVLNCEALRKSWLRDELSRAPPRSGVGHHEVEH